MSFVGVTRSEGLGVSYSDAGDHGGTAQAKACLAKSGIRPPDISIHCRGVTGAADIQGIDLRPLLPFDADQLRNRHDSLSHHTQLISRL
jgi:hypothetical protein